MDLKTRLALLEAAAALTAARVAIALLPFRWIAGLIARGTRILPGRDTPVRSERVGWLLGRTAGRLPFETTCLVRAIAGFAMLRRRRLPAVVVFGVKPSGEGSIEAHAWLVSGSTPVAGQPEEDEFSEIARFSAP